MLDQERAVAEDGADALGLPRKQRRPSGIVIDDLDGTGERNESADRYRGEFLIRHRLRWRVAMFGARNQSPVTMSRSRAETAR